MTIAWSFNDEGDCLLCTPEIDGCAGVAIQFNFDNTMSDVDVTFTYFDYSGNLTTVVVPAGFTAFRVYQNLGCQFYPPVEITASPGFPGPDPNVFTTNDYDFTLCCDQTPTIVATVLPTCCRPMDVVFADDYDPDGEFLQDPPATWDTGQPLLTRGSPKIQGAVG